MPLSPSPSPCPLWKDPRSWLDVALVVAVPLAVVAIAATGPAHTYAHAQLEQIGTVIGTIQSNDWLLPRDLMGGIARKPPMYIWLDVPVVLATDSYSDLAFRAPTIAASLVTAVLVYLLGRRWYGRGVGLLSAWLWAIPHHMGKLMYLATTDMLVAMWVALAILLADPLLVHRDLDPRRQRWWAAALWVTLMLGTLTKGPAVLAIVGATLGLVAAVGPGFAALRAARGPAAKAALAVRLLGRRWWRAMLAVRFGWGMLAYVAVLVPLVGLMLHLGGQEFRRVIYFEYWQRITGGGVEPPNATAVPAVLYLPYYTLPTSALAILALVLAPARAMRRRRRRTGVLGRVQHVLGGLLTRRGPVYVPLAWVTAVVGLFSIPHGFRPDYLLPCYAGWALLAGWAAMTVHRALAAGAAGRVERAGRHVIAAGPIVLGLLLTAVAAAYLLNGRLPEEAREWLPLPAGWSGSARWVLLALLVGGLAAVPLAVRLSLRRRVLANVVLMLPLALAVLYVDTHHFGRHARTGDGQRMLQFARRMSEVVNGDRFGVHATDKLSVELYLGRAGEELRDVAAINDRRPPWFVTTDRGLVDLGAYRRNRNGSFTLRTAEGKVRLDTLPGELGEVLLQTEPIVYQRWGRVYLIRLSPEVRVSSEPWRVGYQSNSGYSPWQ